MLSMLAESLAFTTEAQAPGTELMRLTGVRHGWIVYPGGLKLKRILLQFVCCGVRLGARIHSARKPLDNTAGDRRILGCRSIDDRSVSGANHLEGANRVASAHRRANVLALALCQTGCGESGWVDAQGARGGRGSRPPGLRGHEVEGGAPRHRRRQVPQLRSRLLLRRLRTSPGLFQLSRPFHRTGN